MSSLDDDCAVSLVTRAFSPYLESVNNVISIREAISDYLSLLSERARTGERKDCLHLSKLIPDHVTGAYREYLEALMVNRTARNKYDVLLSDPVSCIPPSEYYTKHACTDSSIQNHLDVLELRQNNDKLAIIKYYATRTRAIAQAETLDKKSASHSADYHDIKDQPTQGLTELVQSTKTLTRNLEIAIIQTQHQLEHEKAYLHRLSTNDRQLVVIDEGAELQALAATRDELTKWLEETLRKCNIDNATEVSIKYADTESTDEAAKNLEGSYDRYIHSREKALAAIAVLRSHTAKLGIEGSDSHIASQEEHLSLHINASIPYLERYRFPRFHLHQEIIQQNDFVGSQIQADFTKTEISMDKLGSESQLLTSHPLPITATESQPVHTTSKEKLFQKKTDDSISLRTKAWSFASQRANDISFKTIESYSKDGQRALADASHLTEDLRHLESLLTKTKT